MESRREYDFHAQKLTRSDLNFAISIDALSLYYYIKETNGSILPRLHKERINLNSFGMVIPRNHKLYEIIDEKIQQLFTAGLVDFYSNEFFKYESKKRYDHLYHDKPQVLTMKNLEAGFVIWLASLSLTLIAFVCEWFIRIMEFVIYKSIFKAFYEHKMCSLMMSSKSIEAV